jgi:hypothetical protein
MCHIGVQSALHGIFGAAMEQRPSLPDDKGHRPRWCIHYRGIGGHDSCAVGVTYDKTFRRGHWPCFMEKATGLPKSDADPCDKLRPPTKEEIATYAAWEARHDDKMRIVLTAVRPWRAKHKGRSFSEIIECAACKGRLHLSISAYNGHVHGRCETADCVSWME